MADIRARATNQYDGLIGWTSVIPGRDAVGNPIWYVSASDGNTVGCAALNREQICALAQRMIDDATRA
jgi:hypothetical protein